MSDIQIEINNETFSIEKNLSLGEIIQSSPMKISGRPLAAYFNNELLDLTTVISQNGTIKVVTETDPEALGLLRHSSAHIMAEAVLALFPEVKVSIGPAIENGFYYDFDTKTPFTPEDLEEIEKKIKEIVKARNKFIRSEMPVAEALDLFEKQGEKYKVELINDLIAKENIKTVSIYKSGNFLDLCRGPHLPHTGMAKAIKLLSVAGAYWRGDEKNPMLQRIYGTSFFDKKDLVQYLNFLEEAKKRDHRRIGKDLNLFSSSDDIGGGLIMWHPKGGILRNILETFEKQEHLKRGYDIVYGPQILKTDLWRKSGHWDNYRDNMYFTEVDNQSYGIKPMNCLAHIYIYKSQLRSFRDLPLRFFELGTVQRHEKSGTLHGLTRVRQFTQDDAHLFCTPEQVDKEIKDVLDLATDFMDALGFKYKIELSTRPEKSIGTDEDWDLATSALKNALQDKGIEYTINEGDGAFYGPKIDVQLQDTIGRSWQCSTIQCDFTLPERFDISYIDSNGEKKRPIMLHRTIFGSIERFIGILIEHFAGAFPLWLAPEQVRILTVTSRADDFANEAKSFFLRKNIRATLDIRNEKLGYKIREAQLAKIPYVLVVGDREAENASVAIRRFGGEDLGVKSLEKFYELIKEEAQPPSWDY